MAAIRRTDIPDDQNIPVHFYIDEAQTVIANDAKVPVILDECRSQMIALTLAHQRLNRITSKEVQDALFNCPVRFASVDNDAPAIAHRFPILTPQQLQLRPHTFACYVRGHTKEAVIFKVPFFDLSTFPSYIPPYQHRNPPIPATKPPIPARNRFLRKNRSHLRTIERRMSPERTWKTFRLCYYYMADVRTWRP
jgi:hypothetical protein